MWAQEDQQLPDTEIMTKGKIFCAITMWNCMDLSKLKDIWKLGAYCTASSYMNFELQAESFKCTFTYASVILLSVRENTYWFSDNADSKECGLQHPLPAGQQGCAKRTGEGKV